VTMKHKTRTAYEHWKPNTISGTYSERTAATNVEKSLDKS